MSTVPSRKRNCVSEPACTALKLYPCNVCYKGNTFLSIEGALQYRKAVTCKKFVARIIEFERNAYEAKRIGGSFKYTQEWEDIEEDELLEILIVKFSTNQYCKQALLKTGDKKLFEATGDQVWAHYLHIVGSVNRITVTERIKAPFLV